MKGYQTYIINRFNENKISVYDVSVKSSVSDGTRDYTFVIEMPQNVNEDDVMSMIEYESVIKSSN